MATASPEQRMVGGLVHAGGARSQGNLPGVQVFPYIPAMRKARMLSAAKSVT
jgi:hypothetical protein